MNRELIQSSIDIDAPPADVWAVVSDLRRMGEWSQQCARMFVLGRDVKAGTRTFNVNKQGKMVWPTAAKVVEFEADRKIAFRVVNRSIWSYELEPTATGTKLTEQRRTPDGVLPFSNLLTRRAYGSIEKFESLLERGIDKTLARIKTEVEA